MPCYFGETDGVSSFEPSTLFLIKYERKRKTNQQFHNHFFVLDQNASTNRSSPATVNNAQPSTHTTERRSPLVISNSTLSPQIQSNVINAHSQNLGVQQISSPVPSSSNSGASINQDDGLKISYEKQPNSRVVQLQEESTTTGRRSR